MKRFLPLLLISILAAAAAFSAGPAPEAGQSKSPHKLTLESIFDPKDKVAFSGAPQGGFSWLDDSTITWPRIDPTGKVVQQSAFDPGTGRERALIDPARLQSSIEQIGIPPEEAHKIVYPVFHSLMASSPDFSPDGRQLLLEIRGDLFLYPISGGALNRLTSNSAPSEQPTFSPDGRKIAFVRGHNLFVLDLAARSERQFTTDGDAKIYEGIFDWVYQEEIYGRGHFQGYWWSPDSARIAFLRLDEHPVHPFTIVDHIPRQQEIDDSPYPLAGDPNPTARLYVADLAGGNPRAVDLDSYSNSDFLIVNVGWSADNKRVIYQIQNREQTWLDLNAADPESGVPTRLLRETTPAWVERGDDPVWLPDGSFLWLSERTGFKHIYHYAADGKLIAPVTSGRWEARELHGADPKGEWIYFSGTERSPIGVDVYRVKIDGDSMQRISDRPGTHKPVFNHSFTQYVDVWSDLTTPPQAALVSADGRTLKTIDANPAPELAQFELVKPELVQVKTRDGFVMEGMLFKPPGFDPSKKYPVYEHTYSGPHLQTVTNEWRGGNTTYLFHQLLAQMGIVVWICDNRTASGKGEESAWPLYKNFGELELRDLEDGLRWLESQPWVDSSRVLLNGWSFGGFMTSYALTHSTMWSAGISGGTVSDWHDYDTIYTERYMQMPQSNPEGYRKSSPRLAAHDLHGNLLLLQGTTDDNVHMQNTIQFAYELEKEGKLFDLMLYPKSKHSISDPLLVYHLRKTMMRFIREQLLQGSPGV